MVYTKKTLAIIGREVVDKHPDIATGIIKNIKPPSSSDIEKIPYYFNLFCITVEKQPQEITGPVYKSSITEIKKIFMAAMLKIYNRQRLFNKTISTVLDQDRGATSRMISEVEFRYQKDESFSNQVDIIFNKIQSIN